jgi:L-seryl-tRNA(Ser) seleniumtransferase
VPALRLLALPVSILRRRARKLAHELARLDGLRCEVDEDTSVPGGGSLPVATLPTAVVRLQATRLAPQALAQRLLKGDPPLVARLARDRVVLDLRTVFIEELRQIPRLLAAALA